MQLCGMELARPRPLSSHPRRGLAIAGVAGEATLHRAAVPGFSRAPDGPAEPTDPTDPVITLLC